MAVIWNNPPRIPSIGGRAARGRGHDAHGPIRHRTGVKPSHRGGRHKSHHDDSLPHNEAEHQEAKARCQAQAYQEVKDNAGMYLLNLHAPGSLSTRFGIP